jgi:queuine tRNA-ribosyltransferase
LPFRLLHTDKQTAARAGVLHTAHGDVETPVFMPVGTLASVKAVSQKDLLSEVRAKIILANTFHLYLRPGIEIIKKAGGLHTFMNLPLPILTDSGGFQVHSLSPIIKIKDDGVMFTSFTDGSSHFFTPRLVIDLQEAMGSDIIMPLDECTPYPCTYSNVKDAVIKTINWLKTSKKHFSLQSSRGIGTSSDGAPNTSMLFGIVQGGVYEDLREESANATIDMDLDGNAIGGLSVGEPAEEMYRITGMVCNMLPAEKPRYLMGVGKPENLLEAIALGIDMFDCVMPTRNARNGWLFTSKGVINLRNNKWKDDFSPIDEDGTASVDTYYSKAYLKHLLHCKEIAGAQIASIHNLAFYIRLMDEARKHILEGNYADWKKNMVKEVSRRL